MTRKRPDSAFPGILIVTEYLPPLYGGADIAAYRFFKFMRKQGKKVMLAGSFDHKAHKEPGVYGLRRGRYKVHSYFNFPLNFVITSLIVTFFFLRNGKGFRIVHCFNGYSDLIYALAFVSYLFRKKVIVESSLVGADDPSAILGTGISKHRYFKNGIYLRRPIYRRVDCHVSKSPYLSELFEQYKAQIKAFHEVPYFVDTTLFRPAGKEERNAIRRRLQIPHNAMVVAFAGGITKRKGVDTLLDAFMLCNNKRADMMLLLIGPSKKYRGAFTKSFLSRTGDLKNVKLTGQVNNVFDYLRAADIYVLPSRREGFPISILEALCCGLWVIGSSIPTIKDVQIRDQENGFIFETESSTDLADKIMNAVQVLQSGDPRVMNAGLRARSEFSIDVIYLKYMDVYSSLCGDFDKELIPE